MAHLCEVYSGIYLTNEEKAWTNLSHNFNYILLVIVVQKKTRIISIL